jgi:hypothetical protein
MSTVRVYNFYWPYDSSIDYKKLATYMGTREYIKSVKADIIEESELELDRSKVDEVGKTAVGFGR